MKISRCMGKASGFTLLEILLAVFIFGVVVSSVYGAYMSTFKTITNAEVETERNQKARIGLEKIIEDIEAVYLGADGFVKAESQEIDSRRADKLEFTSTSHIDFSGKEAGTSMAIIRYTVEKDEDSGHLLLYRADEIQLPGQQPLEEEKGFLLCDGLWQFRIDYIDKSGNETEEWDSENLKNQDTDAENLLPVLVEVELQFANAVGDGGGPLYKAAVALGKIKQDS